MKSAEGARRRAAWAAGFVALLVVAVAVAAPPLPDSHAGTKLDLSRYELTFNEPFDHLSVSPWGPGTRWIAHTPWAGDFGSARFIDPRPDAPFRIVRGILQIEMRRQDGRWQSGLLASANRRSQGFLQSGGYFEARMKLPGGNGVWPAFWLGSNAQNGLANPEIDVIEYYGRFPASYMATTHVWLRGKSIGGKARRIDVPAGSLEAGYHTYGVSIDNQNVIFYLDRREVAREPTRPEYLQPMYLMVDLGAGGGWPITDMPDPSILHVDYIRAFRLKR